MLPFAARWGRLFRWMAGCLLFQACVSKPPPAPRLNDVSFSRSGLEVALSSAARGLRLQVADEQGRPIQELRLSSQDSSPRVPFSWLPDTGYRFTLLQHLKAQGDEVSRRAPALPRLVSTLRIPYGQGEIQLGASEAGSSALVIAGEVVSLGLELTVEEGTEATVRVELELPAGVMLEESSSGGLLRLKSEPPREAVISASIPQHEVCSVKMPARPGDYPLNARVHYRLREVGVGTLEPGAEFSAGVLSAKVTLQVRTLQEVRQLVKVGKWQLPTDAEGGVDESRMSGALVLPNPIWQRLVRPFGLRAYAYDPYEPFAYQSLEIAQSGDAPLRFLCTSTVRRADGGEEKGFLPQAFEISGGLGRQATLAEIPAHGSGHAVLPVYVSRDVLAGTYLQELRVFLMGTSEPLYSDTQPLQVIRSSSVALASTGGALLLSCALFGGLAFSWRKLMTRLHVRALATISLFAALFFVAAFGIELVSTGLTIVLGPFNLLVGGLVFEMLHHLLLATLLTLYSRPGVASLVGLTSYLLKAVMTGQFGPPDVLFLGSSLALKELSLFALGISRGPALLEQSAGVALRLVIALVASAVATALTSLGLHIFFYRLYFADWYLALNVGVATVGASFGALSGLRMGRVLSRIRE